MSPRRWEERIRDILDAIAEIQGFVGEMEYADFELDIKTMRAVELDLIVIGEAANTIPEEVQKKYPHTPWHLMRGMRNRLVYTYFVVSPRILWETIHQDLPPVSESLLEILHQRK